MNSTENNFSNALSVWKDVNLSELQKILDAQGLEIVENQKESVVGRKALAERTKDFKKLPDDEKLNAFKGLLKAYQTEIDSLTKRSKTSENAFLSLYKKLAEVPDPYPLLDAAVEQTVKASLSSQLEVDVTKLREENAALNRKLGELSGVEVAKKAESKVQQLEERIEELVSEKVSQRENELNATYDERLRNYEDREQDLNRQLSLARTQLLELRTSNESNQAKLMDHSQRQDQETVAKLAELDMVTTDLERVNSRVAAVERRNELLRAEIESVRSGSAAAAQVAALERQITELTSESERLSHVLEAQKLASNEIEDNLRHSLAELSKEISNKNDEIDKLSALLSRYSDYDEIKRELDIMKYVEFGGLEEEESGYSSGLQIGSVLGLALPSPNAAKANTQQSLSLELLLSAKNKRLIEELTRLRIVHAELEDSLQRTSEELLSVKSELEEKRELAEKLEVDLLQLEKHRPNGHSVQSPGGSNIPVGEGLFNLDLSIKKSACDSPARTTPIPFTSSADTSILPIVTSQRDRFRQRNAELEEELRKQFQIISELRTEVKSLQSDNLKLYEKVRYMQSYREEGASSTLNPLPAARHDDLSKYHARYEEAMNPFEAFRGRETVRAFQALNPIEKAVFSLTRAILGSRRARNFFVFYALTLHVLVLFTTYECTTSDSTLRTQPRPYR